MLTYQSLNSHTLRKKRLFPLRISFFSKCDQIRRKLWIWSYLLKKSLTENFIFCAVIYDYSMYQASILCYFIWSIVMVLNLNVKFWKLNDHVLLLVLILQKIMAAKKGGGRSSEVNGQMPLRNSKTFCRCSLTYSSLVSNSSFLLYLFWTQIFIIKIFFYLA